MANQEREGFPNRLGIRAQLYQTDVFQFVEKWSEPFTLESQWMNIRHVRWELMLAVCKLFLFNMKAQLKIKDTANMQPLHT